jgi:hypothetical protein
MQDWIAPFVEKEFCNAYLFFRSTYPPGESVEEGRMVIGPNGVSIRMGKGKVVQVIHVSLWGYQYPIYLLIWTSTTGKMM